MTNRVAAEPAHLSRLLLVDDHRSFTDLLALALTSRPDLRVCGTASSSQQAVEMAQRLQPDVVLMDIELGENSSSDGLAATRSIREQCPRTVVVVATAHRDPQWIARAASAGAHAFSPKSGSLDELMTAIGTATVDSVLMSPAALSERLRPVPGHGHLTMRETRVLELAATGLSPAQIARLLDISVHTCRGHVKAIHRKLGVSSQLQAVAKARDLGLFEGA